MPLADPIDMETFQNAIHAWLSTSIDEEVIWAKQSAPRPDYPYGTLEITAGPIKRSQMWEHRAGTDLNRPAGSEILFQVSVPCWFDVSCQVFVNKPDSRHPEASAHNLLTRACHRLGLMSVSDDLKEANVSVLRVDSVLNPGALISDGFVSRASANVAFGTVLSLDEYTGYIATVDIESEELDIDQKIGII